jgi:hypothetical protein
VLVQVAAAVGITMNYEDAGAVRAAIATGMSGTPAFAAITDVTFTKPLAARTWLQSSNPSERWKWDHMFQEVAPVKGFPLILREVK